MTSIMPLFQIKNNLKNETFNIKKSLNQYFQKHHNKIAELINIRLINAVATHQNALSLTEPINIITQSYEDNRGEKDFDNLFYSRSITRNLVTKEITKMLKDHGYIIAYPKNTDPIVDIKDSE